MNQQKLYEQYGKSTYEQTQEMFRLVKRDYPEASRGRGLITIAQRLWVNRKMGGLLGEHKKEKNYKGIYGMLCPPAGGGCGSDNSWIVAWDKKNNKMIVQCSKCKHTKRFSLEDKGIHEHGYIDNSGKRKVKK